MFLDLYTALPEPVNLITVWVITGYVFMDLLVSITAALHLRSHEILTAERIRSSGRYKSRPFRAGASLIGFAERRMAAVYPVIEERTQELFKTGTFAEGCGFYKLFWLFLTGALLGDMTETLYCRAVGGVWMSRSSPCMGAFQHRMGLCHCSGNSPPVQRPPSAGPAHFPCRRLSGRRLRIHMQRPLRARTRPGLLGTTAASPSIWAAGSICSTASSGASPPSFGSKGSTPTFPAGSRRSRRSPDTSPPGSWSSSCAPTCSSPQPPSSGTVSGTAALQPKMAGNMS